MPQDSVAESYSKEILFAASTVFSDVGLDDVSPIFVRGHVNHLLFV